MIYGLERQPSASMRRYEVHPCKIETITEILDNFKLINKIAIQCYTCFRYLVPKFVALLIFSSIKYIAEFLLKLTYVLFPSASLKTIHRNETLSEKFHSQHIVSFYLHFNALGISLLPTKNVYILTTFLHDAYELRKNFRYLA